jgi:hypothetical protein
MWSARAQKFGVGLSIPVFCLEKAGRCRLFLAARLILNLMAAAQPSGSGHGAHLGVGHALSRLAISGHLLEHTCSHESEPSTTLLPRYVQTSRLMSPGGSKS